MKESKSRFEKLTDVIGNAVKSNTSKYLLEKLKEFEKIFLQISWIFFVIGFLLFSNICFVGLFIFELLTAGSSPITYEAIFFGISISLIVGVIMGFIAKTIAYNVLKKKYEKVFNFSDLKEPKK